MTVCFPNLCFSNDGKLDAKELHEIHMITYKLEKGLQYFAKNLKGDQKKAAEKSLAMTQKTLGNRGTIQTPILALQTFHPAEEYHQDFYKKNPVRYKLYRSGCGRDRRLSELWGK